MLDYLYFRNDLHGAHQLPLKTGDVVEVKITRDNTVKTVELELSKGGFDVNYDVDGLLEGGGADTRLDWDQSGAIKPTVYVDDDGEDIFVPINDGTESLLFKPSVSEILDHENVILNDGSPEDDVFVVEDDVLSHGKERKFKHLDESGIIEIPDTEEHLNDLTTFNDEIHDIEQFEKAEDDDMVSYDLSSEPEVEEDEQSGVKEYGDDLFKPFDDDDDPGYDEIESP